MGKSSRRSGQGAGAGSRSPSIADAGSVGSPEPKVAVEMLAIDTFERFYETQFGPMVGLAYQLTGRRDVAEDLVQEAMVRAYRDWGRISSYERPDLWLRRAVLNLTTSIWRRQRTAARSWIASGRPTDVPGPSAETDAVWEQVRGLPRRQAESHLVRLDRTTLIADPPIAVPDNPGLVVAGPDEQLWLTYLEPAGWRSIDVATGTVGEFVTVETEGEMLGVTAAFGALWAPLYDERVLVELDSTGAQLERLPTGVGPALVREFAGWLWHPNRVDGTIARVDPATLDVTIVDLNAGGPTIEQPSAVVSTTDAIWARAARLIDDRAMVFRIDTDTGAVEGRRTLPGDRRLRQIGGMATVGDRLFVLDRPGRVLLELDTDQFLDADLPDPNATVAVPVADQDEAEVDEAVRSLLAAATTPEQMAEGIMDGDRLTEQIAAFKQFFVDNLPGEEYEGDTISVRVDGDVAELEFVVVVAGEPIVDVIPGTAVRRQDRWMLSADSFCRLVATGGIECPADLKGSG